MPVHEPKPPLVKAAQDLVEARQHLEAALLEQKTAAGTVQQARDVGAPAELIDAYEVLADYAATGVAPAEAEYQAMRLIFEERQRDASFDDSAS